MQVSSFKIFRPFVFLSPHIFFSANEGFLVLWKAKEGNLGDSKSHKRALISLLGHAPMGQVGNGHPGREKGTSSVSSDGPGSTGETFAPALAAGS